MAAQRARPLLQSRCSRRYDAKRAPDHERMTEDGADLGVSAATRAFLPSLCEARRANAGREMAEIRSSGAAEVFAYPPCNVC